MIAATVMFAVSSALAKWQVVTYSFAEVLFFRAVVSLVVCAALILPRTGLLVFRTARLRDHLGRSGTQAVAQSLIIIAFSLMPLAAARETDLFLEPDRGEQRGEQRRSEIDGDGAGERHQREGDDDQALRHRLRAAAAEVIAQARGAEYQEAGARQDQRSADDERDDGAEEQHLGERISHNLPFRQRAGDREHHGGGNHVEDAARHAVDARGGQALVEALGGHRGLSLWWRDGMIRLAWQAAVGQGQKGMAASK